MLDTLIELVKGWEGRELIHFDSVYCLRDKGVLVEQKLDLTKQRKDI